MRFTFHLEWLKCVQVKRSGSSHPVVQAHPLNTELNVGTRFLLEGAECNREHWDPRL